MRGQLTTFHIKILTAFLPNLKWHS